MEMVLLVDLAVLVVEMMYLQVDQEDAGTANQGFAGGNTGVTTG
jgi:hypothetical protein